MKKRVSSVQRLLASYQRYQRKLNRIDAGRSRYARRDVIVKRLQRLYAQLIAIKQRYQAATLRTAMGAGLILITAGSQAQNLELKSDNPLQFAHIEGNSRPILIDWDSDGDLDLFVGGQVITELDSSSAGVNYYENDGGRMSEAASPFPADLAIDGVGSGVDAPDSVAVNISFVDLDGDMDQDAFIGQSNGTMLYYRNDDGAMVKADTADNPFAGIKIGDGSFASPTFTDVDGDGDMDAVVGKYDGMIAYYLNDGGTFTEQTNGADDPSPFADLSVGEQASPTFADWDGDGDMDLIVGNKSGELAYFRNDDGTFITVDASENPFAGLNLGFEATPTLGDVDGDGDLDLVSGDQDGGLSYHLNDEGTLNRIERNTIGMGEDLSINASHAFGDIDGDGDHDLARGSFEGRVTVFLNDGGVFSPAPINPLDSNNVSVGYISQPAFADIDADGDVDAFIGSYQNDITYLSNDAGAFTIGEADANPFTGIDAGDNESISFVDFDGDGDMDAFIGNKIGQVQYFENTDGVFAAAAVNPFDGVSFEVEGNPNHPVQTAFADMDGDGDMDGYFGQIDGTMRIFANNGDGTFGELEGDDNPFAGVDFGRSASPAFGDVDGDGDMDLLVTNAAGLTFHFENGGSVSAREFQYNDETKMYPNPVATELTVEIPWIRTTATIQVLDISGRVMSQSKTAEPITNINMATLPSGAYLVKVSSSEGQAIKKVWKR